MRTAEPRRPTPLSALPAKGIRRPLRRRKSQPGSRRRGAQTPRPHQQNHPHSHPQRPLVRHVLHAQDPQTPQPPIGPPSQRHVATDQKQFSRPQPTHASRSSPTAHRQPIAPPSEPADKPAGEKSHFCTGANVHFQLAESCEAGDVDLPASSPNLGNQLAPPWLGQGFGRPGPATGAGRVHDRVSAGPSRSGRRSTGAWSGIAAICSRRWRRSAAPPPLTGPGSLTRGVGLAWGWRYWHFWCQ